MEKIIDTSVTKMEKIENLFGAEVIKVKSKSEKTDTKVDKSKFVQLGLKDLKTVIEDPKSASKEKTIKSKSDGSVVGSVVSSVVSSLKGSVKGSNAGKAKIKKSKKILPPINNASLLNYSGFITKKESNITSPVVPLRAIAKLESP